jgi:hypothetical protein
MGTILNRVKYSISFINNIKKFFVKCMSFFHFIKSTVLDFMKLLLFEFVSIVF